MTTSTKITPQQRLTVLKQLASGQTLDFAAAAVGIDRSDVLDIGNHHGYPDRDKLAWAVDILTKKLDDQATNGIPPAQHMDARPSKHAMTGPTAPPAPVVPTAKPDEFRVLINTAKGSPSKRIRRLADRILDDTAKLGGLLDTERQAAEAKAAAAAEKEKARAEIARLEKALAEARRKAGYARAGGGGAVYGDYPCDAPDCDRTFTTAQGVALHRRRIHTEAAS